MLLKQLSNMKTFCFSGERGLQEKPQFSGETALEGGGGGAPKNFKGNAAAKGVDGIL